jgi:sugar phosphate isomerase/epimerase
MRIGGNILKNYSNPDEWIQCVKDLDYSAVLAPVQFTDSKEIKKAYLEYVKKYDLVIGEVGIWKNPLTLDEKERAEVIRYSEEQLSLADELRANCCVNIVGSRGEIWDGFYEDNYSKDTYALIVDTVRSIIDYVNPQNTFYTLEPMPWMHPDSPDDYLKLIKDIDRKAFAVHLDYANMINSVDKYLNSTAFIKECFQKLGPYIKSIHGKDVLIGSELPCNIREVPPGKGSIKYAMVLKLSERLGANTTLFVEHLNNYEEYKNAITFIRSTAEKENITVKRL